MIFLDTKGGLSIIDDRDWDGPNEIFMTEEEARSLMIGLLDYFEKKDREVLAERLTRRSEV